MRGLDHLPLVYEDDLMGVDAQANTICKVLDFAGLEQRTASTTMAKINSRPLEQTISNHKQAIQWASELGAFG